MRVKSCSTRPSLAFEVNRKRTVRCKNRLNTLAISFSLKQMSTLIQTARRSTTGICLGRHISHPTPVWHTGIRFLGRVLSDSIVGGTFHGEEHS